MTTLVPLQKENTMTREEIRFARDEARRARFREARIRQLRKILYIFICWLQAATTDLPAKVKRLAVDNFARLICLILCMAVLFAVLGLMELAVTFWCNVHFG